MRYLLPLSLLLYVACSASKTAFLPSGGSLDHDELRHPTWVIPLWEDVFLLEQDTVKALSVKRTAVGVRILPESGPPLWCDDYKVVKEETCRR